MLRSSKLVLNMCRKNSKRNEISPCHSSPVAFCEINDGIKNVEINEIKPVITNPPCNFESNLDSDATDWIPACLEVSKKFDHDDETDDDDCSQTIIANVSQFAETDNFYLLPVANCNTESLNTKTG